MSSTEPVAPRPVQDPLVGQNVGGYIVEELLGEGAMGLVYRARHPLLNRLFAIKVLRPEVAAESDSSRNFVREAQTLSSLKHPSIIDIVGFGPLSDGREYLVMEYLLGRTLERELADKGRMDPERALKLSDEILDALSAAHSVDVIHRDLKPSNVFLAKVSGGRELVKLLDFGLAKQQPKEILGESVVAAPGASVLAGTPEYMAPEQARGKAASQQSDLYSFGVMLFEMLTGSLPFLADGDARGSQRIRGLLLKHMHQRAPTIHDSAGGVQFPEGLAEIVADLLKKTPDERPSSAETVRKRLQKAYRTLQQAATQLRPNPLLGAEPAPVALPTTHLPTERVIRVSPTEKEIQAPTARRKSSAPLIAAALVLGLLLLGGAWWWRSRSQGVAEPLHPAPSPIAANPIAEVPAEPIQAAPVPAEVKPQVELAPPAPGPEKIEAPPESPDELADLSPQKLKRRHPVQIVAPTCAADAQWKKGARADLNELVTRAAKLDAETSLWAADREGPLSAAIEAATNENGCGAVELQLAMFKKKVVGL